MPGVVVDNQPRYELVCLECGGFEQDERGEPGIMAMVHCRSCRAWLGRRSALNAHAFNKAHAEGYELDMDRFREEIRAITAMARRPR